MFLREFRVIDAASSVEKLRLRLKQNELEEYGESFIPEYVYQVIRHLPRFRDMRVSLSRPIYMFNILNLLIAGSSARCPGISRFPSRGAS